nr:ABC transporter permease [Galbitalea soli]
MVSRDDVTGSSHTVAALLSVLAVVFTAIAVYVAAVVTVNTIATIVAGRTRTIALYRLVGASSRTLRRSVAREGLAAGAVGSAIGAVVGAGVVAGGLAFAVRGRVIPALPYSPWHAVVVLPVVAVVLTTWLAAWIGSRRVLAVSPLEAISAAEERTLGETAARPARTATAITLFSLGTLLLVAGILLGLVSGLGVLVGLGGGILSFSGVVIGAQLVMPRALRLVAYAFGRSAAARLAGQNALRYPERSTRTTIGLVIGVTLVTMFAVAIGGFEAMVQAARAAQPETYQGIQPTLDATVAVFSVLTGYSALIAAVGLVATLSLSVLQRTRELGLLRALGFSARQVRFMIVVESAQLTSAAVLVGVVLGTGYGWAGAQSLLGSIAGAPGLIVPVLPVAVLATIAGAAAALTVGASLVPARRATRVSPVAALAIE